MWGAEIIAHSESGHTLKIQVTFPEQPDQNAIARLRADAQGLMRKTHACWCSGYTERQWQIN